MCVVIADAQKLGLSIDLLWSPFSSSPQRYCCPAMIPRRPGRSGMTHEGFSCSRGPVCDVLGCRLSGCPRWSSKSSGAQHARCHSTIPRGQENFAMTHEEDGCSRGAVCNVLECRLPGCPRWSSTSSGPPHARRNATIPRAHYVSATAHETARTLRCEIRTGGVSFGCSGCQATPYICHECALEKSPLLLRRVRADCRGRLGCFVGAV